MEAESETAGQQSNGDAEEEDTKQEDKEESSPKKKLKEDTSPKKKVKEDVSPKKKVKEDTTPKKKVDKTESEEEEDGDDESSEEEELPLGSIEAPVQIMTGKRERKKTDRLVFEEPKAPQESMKEIKPGKGTKLGEIPNVSFQINKTNSEFLKPLNSLLFGFIGKMTMVKKNVRQFSGFQFEKDDPEYKKKEQKLFKFTLVGLKELCIWFDLEKGGTKDQICERILAFLLKPEPSGRPLPEKKKKPAKKPSKKRKRKEDGSGDGEKKSKKEKKEKKKSENDEDAANDTVDSVSSLSPDSDEEDEEPKKKKAKVEKKTPKKAAASPKKSATPKKKSEKKKTPKKASTPKKTPKKTTPKKSASYDSDSSDDEPLVKKSSAPSESQIKDTIKKFLAKANLEEVTMKIVCKKVYETYPDFDLAHKKDFIKSTVKSIIS